MQGLYLNTKYMEYTCMIDNPYVFVVDNSENESENRKVKMFREMFSIDNWF